MDRLASIKNTIESMSKTQQIEIFKIIKSNSLDYNENQNGIFINLTGLKSNIIKELEKYISFINKQNAILSKQEEIKEEYLNNYFKDKTPSNNNEPSNESVPANPESEKPESFEQTPVLYAN